MKWISRSLLAITTLTLSVSWQPAFTTNDNVFWVKLKAKDKYARSAIADTGAAIQTVMGEDVFALANQGELSRLQKLGLVDSFDPLVSVLDFPTKDSAYHDYQELTAELTKLSSENSDIVSLSSIGKTIEGRDIWALRISGNLDTANQQPAAIFMGGHHAREHLSVEIPLLLAQYLVNEYRAQNVDVVKLVNSRDIHIIPAVNPDGMEFDIQNSRYQFWRKNRRANGDGTYGVDLNRNYGFKWGTGGSSSSPSSDTYKGPQAFSEIETIAIRDYVEAHPNIKVLLSFHTFSELILYPWGHKYDSIEDQRDFAAHKKIAEKMATWNNYDPMQASDLYIASGDTTDWSYGAHKIISFTFELDPKNTFGTGANGFYPGAQVIPQVFNKNLPAAMYLIDIADNPYK